MRKQALFVFLAFSALVLSAWAVIGQAASRQDSQTSKIVVHDGWQTYIWEVNGNEIVGLTTYRPNVDDNIVDKQHWRIREVKR
jgi:hypothetical protein